MTDSQDLGAIARAIIDENRYMTIGTADDSGLPWVSPVWYASADYTQFFWVSDPGARHSHNIASRPQVSVVIFDSHVPGGLQSVYVSAVAEEQTGPEIERGIAIFNARSVAQGLREWTAEDVLPPARHRLYRATASEHFVLTAQDQRLRVTP